MRINKEKVQVGSDFEMFLMDKNEKVISAIPFNTGTKTIPEKLEREGCCIQRDGVLQECNVPAVLLGESELLWLNIEYVKKFIEEKFAKKDNLRLVCCPTAILEDDQLEEEEARQFGCEPDYNAWEDGVINMIDRDENTKLRSCGGHIHMSFDRINGEDILSLMKLFDLYLTVPFVLIDKDKTRRILYGRAGSFRPKTYGEREGFEARTLSNIWVGSKELTNYIFHQLNGLVDHYNERGFDIPAEMTQSIINCINNSDEELAKHICEEMNILLPLTLIQEA